MEINRKFLIVMLSVVLVMLAACESSFNESNALNENSTENTSNTDKTNTDRIGMENNDPYEKVDTSGNVDEKEDDFTINNVESLKEEYLKKLNDTKKELDEIRNNSEDENTYAMKKVEGDRYDIWDGLLNEVYGVLKNQLPSEEMDQLRIEQREWIDYRDNSAKEASLKYKGGTHEHLEYVMILNMLTEERCFELVEDHMN